MLNSFVGYTAELSVLVHDCLKILFLLYLLSALLVLKEIFNIDKYILAISPSKLVIIGFYEVE